MDLVGKRKKKIDAKIKKAMQHIHAKHTDTKMLH